MREKAHKWGTRIGILGALAAGPGVGLYEHLATEEGWDWDLNENVALGFFALAVLSAIFFGGPKPKAQTGRKKED